VNNKKKKNCSPKKQNLLTKREHFQPRLHPRRPRRPRHSRRFPCLWQNNHQTQKQTKTKNKNKTSVCSLSRSACSNASDKHFLSLFALLTSNFWSSSSNISTFERQNRHCIMRKKKTTRTVAHASLPLAVLACVKN
jgi:hypothetical protein